MGDLFLTPEARPWKLTISQIGDLYRWEVEGVTGGVASSAQQARRAAYAAIARDQNKRREVNKSGSEG